MTSVTLEVHEGGRILACPNCGSAGLSHTEVEVFGRAEDVARAAGNMTDREGRRVSLVPNDGSGDVRRYGLVIRFACADCVLPYELTLVQDKGSTFIEWRVAVDAAALYAPPPAKPHLSVVRRPPPGYLDQDASDIPF